MLKYILKRTLQMVPTVFGVILLTFILFNIVPNDLAAIALGKNVTLEMLENFDAQRGLNKPLFIGTRAKTRAYAEQDFSKGEIEDQGFLYRVTPQQVLDVVDAVAQLC